MGPKSATPQTQQLFGYPLEHQVNLKHPLIQRNAKPKTVIVDKGYQGVKIDGIEILRLGQRRVTLTMKAMQWSSGAAPLSQP